MDTLGVTAPPSRTTGRARPKSAILSTPAPLTSTLWGLRSCRGREDAAFILIFENHGPRGSSQRRPAAGFAGETSDWFSRSLTLCNAGAAWIAWIPSSSWWVAVSTSASGNGLSRALMTWLGGQ